MKEDSMSASDVKIPPKTSAASDSLSQEIGEIKSRYKAGATMSCDVIGFVKPIQDIFKLFTIVEELQTRDKQWEAKYLQTMDLWVEQGVRRDNEIERLQRENEELQAKNTEMYFEFEAEQRALEDKIRIAKVSLAEQGDEIRELKEQRDTYKSIGEEAVKLVQDREERLAEALAAIDTIEEIIKPK